ncbi:MAG: hypothetical protein HRT68_04295 [Flavobacteriaceae bacterium]|nr:hypothetical protein [Flavobacteriaceae bacterium]
MTDIVILTQADYINPTEKNSFVDNILLEDGLLQTALENQGLKVQRLSWDDPDFDWSTTQYALIRTTWDYQDRFEEFSNWLDHVSTQTTLLNPAEVIRWNIDKHYLKDLSDNGVHIAPTRFVEIGESITLSALLAETNWETCVLKPCVSAGGRDTYKISSENYQEYEARFQELIQTEAMMLQPFLKRIIEKGEISLMVLDGKYTHAVLKTAKSGEFRIQDDHGGSVHHYAPTQEEIDFAEATIKACKTNPVYARVDIIEDNDGKLSLAEIELVEPELWFRFHKEASDVLATGIKKLF